LKPKKNFGELNTNETNLTKNVSYIKFSSQYTNKYIKKTMEKNRFC